MEINFRDKTTGSTLIKYAVAITAPVVALFLRLPLTPYLGEKIPFSTFFLATAVSAYIGGFVPGLLSTVLGGLLAALFIIPRFGSMFFTDTVDCVAWFVFLAVSAIISYFAGARMQAQLRESELRLLFQQTLLSIGDGVISTDSEKRVMLMNRVAEDLAGWTHAEAQGKSVSKVFRIVREGSDTPAEDPVSKVFASGAIVELPRNSELLT